LCGPMRIDSINGKRYVLVIVDDYSRYTWVHFLRSKDEAPEVIIKFLKRITVLLHFFIISSITVQTSGSGIFNLLAMGTTFTGSGNLYCQWELSPGSISKANQNWVFGILERQPLTWKPTQTATMLEEILTGNPQQEVVNFLAGDLFHGSVKTNNSSYFNYRGRIYIDNESTICIIKNLVFHSKSKHIEIRNHFIRDAYEKKLIQLHWLREADCDKLILVCELMGDDSCWYSTDSGQTETGKELSNPLMAGSFPKTILPTQLTSAKVTTVNDEVRIQALVDGKRVNIKESSIRRILRLDDAKDTSCLTNIEIFKGLAKMGYEKPSDKLTFYKAFFSPQWKFLIHTILQCLSAKTTSWNEFSSTMAFAIICLATNQKFNFSREVTPLFDNMLVQAPEKVGILQADAQSIPITTEPSTSKPQKKQTPKRKHTQESEVHLTESPAEQNLPSPFNDPLPSGEDSLKIKELMDLCTNLSNKDLELESKVIDIKSTCQERIKKLEGRVERLEEENMVLKKLKSVPSADDVDEPVMEKEKSSKQGRKIADSDADALSMIDVNEEEPGDVKEVLEVVKAAKLMTEVVTTAGATKVSVPRKRRCVIIQDPKETTTTATVQPKVNEGVKVSETEVRQEKDVEVESSKREDESLEQEIAKKQKMEEETKELKKNLQIVDYKIHTERNRPYFKIIRADGNHMLFISLSLMLKNFDREDLESLWIIVRDRFKKTKPKNCSDDYFLNTLKIMFEKLNVEASMWKDQKGRYGLAKVKSWKLIESCGVHCITFSSTKIFLLVERMYPLTHFTLRQMLNNVRL
nr:ribonuclease H-like domain-containing protein [Tanacetum cinerariifolium]